jgi:hypothetical protein
LKDFNRVSAKKFLQAAPLEAAPVLVLQGACPESACLRHSPGTPLGDRLSMRLSSHAAWKEAGNACFAALPIKLRFDVTCIWQNVVCYH